MIYAMRFEGRAEPVSKSGTVRRAATSAPSSTITVTVGPEGVVGTLRPAPGGVAILSSKVALTGETSFQEDETIGYRDCRSLRFSTVGKGHLAPIVDRAGKYGDGS